MSTTDKRRKTGKRERRKQQLTKEKRRRRLIIGAAIALIVGAVGLLAYMRLRPVEGAEDFGAQERGHDAGVVFAETGLPPVGGTHDPRWQNCGIYTGPVDTPLAVHSMEHGAVWVTYSPELPATDVAKLQDKVRGESYMLLSPFPGLSNDLVLTAWGVQLPLDSVDDKRFEQFIERYRGAGPEPGSPCNQGIGRPLQ